MKKIAKLFLAFVFAAVGLSVVAQNGYIPVYVVADTALKFQRPIEIGTPIYVVSDNKFYMSKVRIGAVGAYNVNYLLGSASRYTQPDFASSTTLTTENATVQDTLFLGTTDNYIWEVNTNGIGIPNSFRMQDTLFLKSNYLWQPNVNRLNVPNSWGIADTAFVGVNYIWQNTVNGLAIPNSLTLPDTGFIATVSATKVLVGAQSLVQTNTNKATINNSLAITDTAFTNGLSVTGKIEQVPTRAATEYWYGTSINDDGTGSAFTALTPAKTYMNYISVRRVVGTAMTGDSRDVLYKATYSNYASNDASSQFQGIGISGRNRSGGVFATMNAGEFGINNSSGATLTTAYGSTFTVENYGTLSTTMCGVKIDLRNEGAVATDEYGLYITNTNNSLATAADAAIKVADAGANIGWTAGIDMSGATISRAIIFPTGAAADTTVKTAGALIYLANMFYGCNGTFWYPLMPTP